MCALTGLGLNGAKDLVEDVPRPIKEGGSKSEAEEIKVRLEAVGATVKLNYLRVASNIPPEDEAKSLRSPVEAELAELGFPSDYGLPAPPHLSSVVTWLRATIGFAYRTFKKGEWDFAINDANKLINDDNLNKLPQYVMVLAAAYYVRGRAYEEKGDKAQASRDYQASLQLLPNYVPAMSAFERGKHTGEPLTPIAPSKVRQAWGILAAIILIVLLAVYYSNQEGNRSNNQPVLQHQEEPVQSKDEPPGVPPAPQIGPGAFGDSHEKPIQPDDEPLPVPPPLPLGPHVGDESQGVPPQSALGPSAGEVRDEPQDVPSAPRIGPNP